MKRVMLFAVTAFAFAILPSFKLPPATVVDSHFEQAVAFVIVNPCNGDLISITGDEVFDTHAVFNGNRANFSSHADGDYEGTGASGDSYHGTASYQIHQNFPAVNGAFSYNVEYQVHFIGQGTAPNWKTTEQLHVTVNADGTTTVLRSDITTDCH